MRDAPVYSSKGTSVAAACRWLAARPPGRRVRAEPYASPTPPGSSPVAGVSGRRGRGGAGGPEGVGTHTEALTGLVSGSWAVGETAVRGTGGRSLEPAWPGPRWALSRPPRETPSAFSLSSGWCLLGGGLGGRTSGLHPAVYERGRGLRGPLGLRAGHWPLSAGPSPCSEARSRPLPSPLPPTSRCGGVPAHTSFYRRGDWAAGVTALCPHAHLGSQRCHGGEGAPCWGPAAGLCAWGPASCRGDRFCRHLA